MLKQANETLGHCAACGTLIEPEDWFDTDTRTHMECCAKKQQESSSFELTSGFLFDDAERATIKKAKEVIGARHISFDGPTALGVDVPRLSAQLARVFTLMSDGEFRSLSVIAESVGCLETSASARLRDLRKTRFGGHTVISRQVANSPGAYEYKLIVREKNKGDGQRNAA